ncbi:DoxX family protein [Membranicola marinus]|uniref:DoxX family protein n=1 Tax=Membranihabitans marinus TaxID=1227546 RepID=A0A953I0B0_9BACT|nr:DoxX family protein [Membranihabitans marinus]MBY5960031.1 DoxX family protein [Membranihabitans marinus]
MAKYTNLAFLLLRIVIGLMMIFGHGWGKLMKVLDGNWAFPEILGIPAAVSLILAVLIEVGCSLLLIIGYKTRIVATFLFLIMVSALLFIHADDPLFIAHANGGASKELAILYGIVYLVLALAGGGKYGVNKG